MRLEAPQGAIRQSLWLKPGELARRSASLARQKVLEAVARTAQLGDRLAAVEVPGNRLPRLVAWAARPDPWAPPYTRSPAWPVKGGRVSVDA